MNLSRPVIPFRVARLLLGALACVAISATPTMAAIGDRSPDGVWSEAAPNAVAPGTLTETFDTPGAYRLYQLDDLALFGILRAAPMEFTPAAQPSSTVLTLPMPDGTFARFRVAESPILAPKIAVDYPDVRTYVAQGIDDPTHSARLDRTPLGFNAIVVTPGDFILVKRATTVAGTLYMTFKKSDLPAPDGMSCTIDAERAPRELPRVNAPPSGANLRTYDLALVTSGEFTDFYGSDAATLAAVTGHINAVNALYEREVAIRFTIVCTSFYDDGTTDPFTNPQNVDGTLLDQADATLDADCGANAYEIGHLLHLRAGAGNSFSGRAAISSVCQGDKGRAASTGTNPNSTLFVVDLIPHEMGHQFSAQHTYNSTAGGCVERTATSAYEIGSGTSIMSYACAGCTGEDVNGNGCADAYFHTHSFDQITNYREAGGNCGAQTATGNTAPGVNAGGDRTIPRGTPFTLTATGNDAEGDALTWCWEQHDLGAASPPLGGGNGPLFRTFLPVTSPSRTFPNLTDLLAGTATPFEILPTTDRTMTFRATARDNRAGGGGVNYDTIVLTVAGDPFVLNYPNGGQSLNAGCTINVQWTVGGGNVAPSVNILFSQDGGVTFPTTLASGVPNDGAHEVVLPCVATTQSDARIKIEGAGNVFFDVSNSNFTVTPQAPVAAIKAPAQVEVDANCSVTFNVSGNVTDDCAVSAANVSVTATAQGGTATVVPNIVLVQNGAGEVTFSGTVTVSDLTGCPAVVRVQVDGADGCALAASDFADVTVIDPIAPTVVTQATGGEVGPTCTYVLPFSATLNDNCKIDAADVAVTITNPSNNATLGIPQYVAQQVAPGHVEVSGTVLVSDLQSCPARILVEVGIGDGCSNAASDTSEVEVIDTTPPEITVALNRQFLWPPNHKMVDITAAVEVTDNCPNPSFVLTSITSNEPPNDNGDGNFEPDWSGADFGTPDVAFQLRSERMGPRNGRVYTITYTASDNCGNSDVAVVEVRVQHDQSGNAVVVQVGSPGGRGGDLLAVVVPSVSLMPGDPDEPGSPVDRSVSEARRSEVASGLLAGNTAGVVGPAQVTRSDIDGDGLPDAIALFEMDKAGVVRDASDELDGPVGLHYRNAFGETFLVTDLLAVPREDASSPQGEAVLAALGSEALVVPSALVQASGPAAPIADSPDELQAAGLPAITRLAGFRPNPFFRMTSVSFELARPAQVRLEVYSPAGTRVRGLAELKFEAGRHAVTWDGRDDSGRRVSPGVYFVRFIGDGVVNTGKALLLP